MPLSYPWGSESQVDWYEAYADLGGERTCLQVFEMRSMAGGGAFHRAYHRATQQAFLEAYHRTRSPIGVFIISIQNLQPIVKLNCYK
jgi:hypothetical protein